MRNPTHTFATAGSYTVSLKATGPGGSNTVTQASYIRVCAPGSSAGLVAAYAFEDGSGNLVKDNSGNGNTGTIANAVWSSQGRFGRALSFSGNQSWVTVNDAPSLNLSAAMTLEAWIYPTVALNDWIDVIMKERQGGASYYLCGGSQWGAPVAGM